MSLVKIVKGLKKEVSHIRRHNNKKIITYHLDGKIIIEKDKRLYFEGYLTYRTNFESHPPRSNKRRFLHSGRANSAPILNSQEIINLIIANANNSANNSPYKVSYDKKNDVIKIEVLKNKKRELRIARKNLGKPSKQEFRIVLLGRIKNLYK